MERARGKKKWIVAAAVVIVAGGGTGAWAVAPSSGSSSAAATTTVTTASRGTIQQTVASTGTIEPKDDEDLTFSASGTVTAVKATVGQKVAKGAVLATVDTTTLQSAVDTATAAVTAAQEQVTAEASSTTTQQASAAAQLASAQTALTAAQASLADASLKAPFAGTVAAVTMAVGDVIGGSASSSGGPSNSSSASSTGSTSTTTTATDAITLISTNSWIVKASVGSADLAQLTKSMQVQITPSGATTTLFGTISSIGIVADSSTSGSATFPVVVAVTGNPTGLYAGASATLSFIVKSVPDVLTVPTLALTTTNGKTTVIKVVGGKKVLTPVTVGTSYGASTEITAGITDGDKIEVPVFGPGAGTRRTGTGTGTGGGTGGFGGTGQGAP